MAKISDITFDIGISVSQETVNRCCQLLSIYLTDNLNKDIDVAEWRDYETGKIIRNMEITTNNDKSDGGAE